MKETRILIAAVAKSLGAYRFDYDIKYTSHDGNEDHVIALYFNEGIVLAIEDSPEKSMESVKAKAIAKKEKDIAKAKELLGITSNI